MQVFGSNSSSYTFSYSKAFSVSSGSRTSTAFAEYACEYGLTLHPSGRRAETFIGSVNRDAGQHAAGSPHRLVSVRVAGPSQMDLIDGLEFFIINGHRNTETECKLLPKRPITPAYVFFFLLFWPDTWRILFGLIAAAVVPPLIMPPDLGWFGTGMFYVMIACIGYAASAAPARGIARLLRRWILKQSGKPPK